MRLTVQEAGAHATFFNRWKYSLDTHLRLSLLHRKYFRWKKKASEMLHDIYILTFLLRVLRNWREVDFFFKGHVPFFPGPESKATLLQVPLFVSIDYMTVGP